MTWLICSLLLASIVVHVALIRVLIVAISQIMKLQIDVADAGLQREVKHD